MKAKERLISRAELKDRISYDPISGKFAWLKTTRSDRLGIEPGCINGNGYRVIRLKGSAFLAHRLAWFYMYGEWPREIDHRDRDRLNNKLSNLRPCTNVQNQANKPCSSKIGFKGVSPNGSKFQAHIRKSGRLTYLGNFSTPEEAYAAYVSEARRMYGDFALVGKSEVMK